MMDNNSKLEHALELAKMGFHVFPLKTNSKLPLIKDFPNVASRDPKKIESLWRDPVMGMERDYNIGISTSRFGDDEFLLAIDVDNKGKKKGDEELLKLELQGKEFPPTFTQITPTLGKHLVYRVNKPIKQGVNTLAPGIDTRANGGYIVGAGSTLDGRFYTRNDKPIVYAPEYLIESCAKNERVELKIVTDAKINTDSAIKRATHYLEKEAPLAIENQGGDQTTFVVCAKLKDEGLSESDCLKLLTEHWNDRCSPPWSIEDLEKKIKNSFDYGVNEPGSNAPESVFTPVEKTEATEETKSFLQKLNDTFAVVFFDGGHSILEETISGGRKTIKFHNEASFKRLFSNRILESKKTWAEAWLNWTGRRDYNGIGFFPLIDPPKGYYNTFRGFAVEPLPYKDATKEAREGLDMLLSHALTNLCKGEEEHFNWLIGYCAHMIQRPWEKPLTSVVFRGQKGVGKSFFVERLQELIGTEHFQIAANVRYLTSNFNSFMESCLCLVLEEAFWSGDKAAEGQFKFYTTSKTIPIERKGKETYNINNYIRIFNITNEDWATPASNDERRVAVFDVGEGRKQDLNFFGLMKKRLTEQGGNRVLLHYLQNFDLSKADINQIPMTEGLLAQKIESLDLFNKFWFDSLRDGYVLNTGVNVWLEDVEKKSFRDAFYLYCKNANVRSRLLPSDIAVGKALRKVLPQIVADQKKRVGTETIHIYRFPTLQQCRDAWDDFMKQKTKWDE